MIAPAPKTLYLLRHAKAANAAAGQDDHDRPLSAEGIAQAQAMGRYLQRHNISPQHVLCSDAVRTRQTWDLIAPQIPATYSHPLYLATAPALLRLLAETPEDAARLMLIGHNPGLHQLALALAQAGEEELRHRLALEFPTCALAIFHIDTRWSHIPQTGGTLADLITHVSSEKLPDSL